MRFANFCYTDEDLMTRNAKQYKYIYILNNNGVTIYFRCYFFFAIVDMLDIMNNSG